MHTTTKEDRIHCIHGTDTTTCTVETIVEGVRLRLRLGVVSEDGGRVLLRERVGRLDH